MTSIWKLEMKICILHHFPFQQLFFQVGSFLPQASTLTLSDELQNLTYIKFNTLASRNFLGNLEQFTFTSRIFYDAR